MKKLVLVLATIFVMSGKCFAQPREEDFITTTRADATAILKALLDLQNKQGEWNSLQYGTILSTGTGNNNGITSSQVGAVVFDTANALLAVLNANGGAHLGNLYKISGTQAPQ